MKGRKNVPTRLKLLQGNPGKKKLNKNEPKPKSGIPIIPKWLKEFPLAVKEWRREVKILDAMRVMTIADAGTLAMRCYLASQIQEMAIDIKKEGRVVYTSRMDSLGNEIMDAKTNPKSNQLKNSITEYRQLGSLLGLDPSSRAKLSVDIREKKSKFDGLIGNNQRVKKIKHE